MRDDRVIRRWAGAITLAIGLLQVSLVDAATPLQKIVFVFSGFNERTSFIFVAKDMRFFEEQGLEVEGIRNTLRILERVDPKFGRLKAENLVDDRIVRKLERDGVFK